MSLSKDLISQFVKATKDATTVKKESTVYGTVVKYNEKTYVKIDGSDLLTPAETLSSVEEGERVSIMIKDHTATITGNYTAPSASSIKVDGMDADLKANTADIKNLVAKNAEIENLVASKATIEDLRAANAEIDTLKSNYAEIETLVADKASIGDLEAVNADIKSLKADKADIAHLEANYATIGSLNAVYADVTRLEADKANIKDLEANYATIESLEANYATINQLESNYATIKQLDAANANITNLQTETANINTALIDKANVSDLAAANAVINDLKAGKADIGDLSAANAKIADLEAGKADISVLEANYATIKQLDATNANVTNLQTETANINKALIDKADISDLNATNANITNLQATKANVSDLNATNTNVNTLTGNLADITTLVNGNLTSDNIQSMVITGDKFTVEDGFIKNAMIDSVNANKINAGVINTNNVSIQSNDGSMVLQGNLQQFKDKNGKVRIQIGKDATGNFTFVLYDENGTGQLINQNGIQSSNAIADGLIVDSKVADNANIAGSKLDIDSVVTEVNNGTTSIKGTKIYLDDQKQSLNVAFNNMSTTVKGNTNTIQSHTTSINTMNGKVTQLISDTTITKQDGTTTSLKDAYNATVDTVDSHSTKIGSLETNLATANNNISSVSSKQSALEQNLNGFKQTVSETYTTKAEFDNLEIGGTNLLLNSNKEFANNDYNIAHYFPSSPLVEGEQYTISLCVTPAKGVTNFSAYLSQGYRNNADLVVSGTGKQIITKTFYAFYSEGREPSVNSSYATIHLYRFPNDGTVTNNSTVHWIKIEKGNKATDWTPAPQDIDASITAVDNKFVNYSTTSQMNSAITQKANEITSTVSETYATKASLTTVDNKFADYSTTSAMNSAINQKANEITSTVSETYATKTSLKATDDKFANYSTTSAMNSAINQKADSILSTVSKTYATQTSLTDVSNNLKNNYSTTSAMNSAINQKANEITSTVSKTYATKTSVTDVSNNLKNNYSTTSAMNSAINQKANEITSSVSQTYATKSDFNNLNIGGTNLLRNSTFNYDSDKWWNGAGINYNPIVNEGVDGGKCVKFIGKLNTTYHMSQDIIKLKPNTQYTFTAYYKTKDIVKGTTNPYFNFNLSYNQDSTYKSEISLVGNMQLNTNGWVKVTKTFTTRTTNDWNLAILRLFCRDCTGTIWYDHMKLEEGNKATDWSPAPEDADNAIATVDAKFTNYSTTSQMNSAITQKANEITSTVSETYATKTALNTVDGKFANYSTTSAMNSAINQKSDSILSTVSGTYATKTALNTVDGKFANYSTTSAMNSAINQKSDSILSTVSNTYTTKADFNNLNIGGTNLVTNSCFAGGSTTGWGTNQSSTCSVTVINETSSPTGKALKLAVTSTAPGRGVYNFITPKSIGEYTLSFYGKSDTAGYKIYMTWEQCKDKDIELTTSWQKYTLTMNKTNLNRNAIAVYTRLNSANGNFYVHSFKLEKGNKATSWSPAPEDVNASISAVDGKFVNYSTTSQMNSAINQKANEITSTVSETYATKTALNTVDGKFANYSTTSQMNSAINQKSDSILSTVSGTYATKTALNTVDGKFANYSTTSAMNSAINQKADGILSTVSNTYTTKADFNGLTIGGTNLLLGSKREYTNNDYCVAQYYPSSPLVEGEQYTISLCVTPAKGVTRFDAFLSNGYRNNVSLLVNGTNKQVITKTFTAYYHDGREPSVNMDNAVVQLFRFPNDGTVTGNSTVHWVKIEKGNKATSWSPAPEDIDNAITTVDGKFASYSTTSQMNSAINQKANEITSTVSQTYATKSALTTVDNKFANYSTTSAMNSAINQKGDSILSTVSSNYATKTALTTVDNKFANYSTTSAMNTAINQKANEITSSVSSTYATKSEFNNLTIGGTNLLANSTFNYSFDGWGRTTTDTSKIAILSEGFDGGKCVRINGALNTTYIVYQDLKNIKKNTEYIMTGYYKTSNVVKGTTNPYIYVAGEFNQDTTTWRQDITFTPSLTGSTDGWTKFSTKIRTRSSDDWNTLRIILYVRDCTGTLWFDQLKLEEGNKATDWSASPDDISIAADNINVGGVNLVVNSCFAKGSTTGWGINQSSTCSATVIDEATSPTGKALKLAVTSTGVGRGVYNFVTPKSTGEYTLSFYGKSDTAGYNIYMTWEGCASKDIQLTTSWQKYVLTVNRTNLNRNAIIVYTQTNSANGNFYVHSFKLEKGNKATAWSPAPEDVDSAIATVDGKFANYSTTSQMNSAITQKGNEITQSVSNTYATKAQFNALDVGGRNLYTGTKDWTGSAWVNKSLYTVLDTYVYGCKITRRVGSWSGIRQEISITPNTYYTLSAWIKGYGGAKLNAYCDGVVKTRNFNQNEVLSTEWKRYWFTFDSGTATVNKARFENSVDGATYDICGLKLEKGNKATDWSPAPEDIDLAITAVDNKFVNYSTTTAMNTAINQKAESITQSVSETYATKTSLKSANDNITSLTNRMKSAESKLTKDSLTTTIGSYYTTSTDVNNLVTAKGYATTSEVSQTANSLTTMFRESGGYNLLYNGNFRRGFDHWETSGAGWMYEQNQYSKGGYDINVTGELSTTKYAVQNINITEQNVDKYVASCWMYTTSSGSDGTTNPFKQLYVEVYYTDDTISYYDNGNSVYDSWQQVSIYITRPSDKYIKRINVYGLVRDTTKRVYFSAMQVEKGTQPTTYTPNPNEVYDGITQIDKDGIKVKHTSIDSNSYTHMSPTGFYLKNKGTDIFKVDTNGLYVKGNGDFTGKVTANDGSIGGFTISSGKLVGTGGNGVGMSGNGTDWAFWAGSNTGGNAPFHVGHEGNLYATQAYITGTITGSTINAGTINGATINSDSFIGDMLAIDGTISAKSLQVQDIDNAKYPGAVTADFKLYVSTSGNDDSEIENGATFATFDGLLDKLPKNLNGHEVRIEMSTDITENVDFKGFHGGKIRLYMKGHTLYGYLVSRMGSARINVNSGYIGNASDTSNGWGKIHPSKGYAVSSYTTTVASVDQGCIGLYNIDVYGADNYLSGSTTKLGVAGQDWGTAYLNGVSYYGCDMGARANAGGRIHDVLSYNVCTKYGFYATTGGYITLAGSEHSGGKSKNYHEADAGKVIVASGATFAGGEASVPGGAAPVVPTTKTVTIKSTYGDTYRSSVYNSWKKDGTARQGDYGYGDCNGCWFFGDAFSDLEGKTINKVTIKITRQSGGSSSAVGLVVKSHGHSGRPSGAPSYRTTAGTLSLATGASGTLTITNSTILSEISSGAVKGFGIQSTYNSSNYAVCSGSVTVKITYTE